MAVYYPSALKPRTDLFPLLEVHMYILKKFNTFLICPCIWSVCVFKILQLRRQVSLNNWQIQSIFEHPHARVHVKWGFPIFGHISAICGWILLQYGSFGSLWISSYTQGPKGPKSPKCESSGSDHRNQPGGLKPGPDRGNNSPLILSVRFDCWG